MITFIPLTGFLGAGKTTTMIAAALALQDRGHRVAVITNDQGTELVDSRLARDALGSAAEVTGGCFCCRFEDLAAAIAVRVSQDGIDTVIAEAVGSCTDLQATVVRPLRLYYGDTVAVTPLTTVLDPMRHQAFERAAQRGEPESDLSYLFRQQLSEADVIAVNKLDLVPAARAADITALLRARYPSAAVVGYSAATGDGIGELLGAWNGPASNHGVDLGVDYDRYAAAEAQLAWLNQEIGLAAGPAPFDPAGWARTVLEHLSGWAASAGAVVGHAKITVETPGGGLAKLSLVCAGEAPVLDRAGPGQAQRATALINARVATGPQSLDEAVAEAVAAAGVAHRVTSSGVPAAAFQPGYPTPVHRLPPTGPAPGRGESWLAPAPGGRPGRP